MKINQFSIFIICVLFGQIIANNNFNDKQETLNEIQIEIQNLENELKEQIKNQKGTKKKLTEIKNQIIIQKKELLKKQNQESYQLQLLKNINNVVDSLTQSSLKTEKEKNKIKNLISDIKINQESATEQIVTLNEELINNDTGFPLSCKKRKSDDERLGSRFTFNTDNVVSKIKEIIDISDEIIDDIVFKGIAFAMNKFNSKIQ